jgi:hypothetical protein
MKKGICFATVAVLALSVTVLGGPRATAGARDKASKISPAPQPAAVIKQLDGIKPMTRFQAVEVPERVPRIYNDGSTRGSTAAGAATTFVYSCDYWSGYGVFLNYEPNTGAYFPGTMQADEMFLGNGFTAGGTISAMEVVLYRSSLDITNPLQLADYRIELWDGDPFNVFDSVGTPPAMIPGAFGDFTGVPGPGAYYLTVEFDPEVTVPTDRTWMVIQGDKTCRTGWIICSQVPSVGSIYMGVDDVWEQSEDYDGQLYGGNCCPGDEVCDIYTAPCTGDVGTFRGFCSDGFAESGGLWYFGGPCDGLPGDFCASFMGNIYATTDTYIAMVPVASSDGAAVIDGTGITLSPDACSGTTVDFEIHIQGWGPALLKTWEADIDSSGYGASVSGYVTPNAIACTVAQDCIDAWGGVCSLTLTRARRLATARWHRSRSASPHRATSRRVWAASARLASSTPVGPTACCSRSCRRSTSARSTTVSAPLCHRAALRSPMAVVSTTVVL